MTENASPVHVLCIFDRHNGKPQLPSRRFTPFFFFEVLFGALVSIAKIKV